LGTIAVLRSGPRSESDFFFNGWGIVYVVHVGFFGVFVGTYAHAHTHIYTRTHAHVGRSHTHRYTRADVHAHALAHAHTRANYIFANSYFAYILN